MNDGWNKLAIPTCDCLLELFDEIKNQKTILQKTNGLESSRKTDFRLYDQQQNQSLIKTMEKEVLE